jgi:hypothetical protein
MCFPDLGKGGRNEPDDALPKIEGKPEVAK